MLLIRELSQAYMKVYFLYTEYIYLVYFSQLCEMEVSLGFVEVKGCQSKSLLCKPDITSSYSIKYWLTSALYEDISKFT